MIIISAEYTPGHTALAQKLGGEAGNERQPVRTCDRAGMGKGCEVFSSHPGGMRGYLLPYNTSFRGLPCCAL